MSIAERDVLIEPQPHTREVSTRNFRLSERTYPSLSFSPQHVHTKHYIIVTLDGQYLSVFGGRTEKFKPWAVSYHRAGASHASRYGDKGAKVLYIELPVEQLQSFGEYSAYHLSTVTLQGGITEWTARNLYREFDTPDRLSPVVLDSYILQLLAHVCRRSQQLPQSPPSWLGHTDELIRERFMEPLGLTRLAKAVNVHPVHLAREFRRYYCCTVGEQIRRLRIEFACEQLSTASKTLCDIALEAGFADQSHFTMTFKQQVGMTPSRYRRDTQLDVTASTKR
jgi:AraC family transcriptional regulator